MVAPPGGIARLTVMLCAIAHASGQTVPKFRSDAPLQLSDVNTGAAETSPAAGDHRELFTTLPDLRTQPSSTLGSLRNGPPIQGASRKTPWAQMPFRISGPPAAASSARTPERPPETPISLQRHPGRNLTSQDGSTTFTLRSTSAAEVLARLSVGLQADTRHTDNLTNAPRNSAIEDVIMEWRPIFQIELGSPPTGCTADAQSTDCFLSLIYTPTFHTLIDEGTSRTLQRVSGEIGRAGRALTTVVRFEHDENIFGARGDNTVEESSTQTSVSPRIEYRLNAKTAIHAEGTWRRVAPEDASVRRSEYILETGIACEATAKTTLGAGMEFGNLRFDQAKYGEQNYEQAYVSAEWQASPKIRFQTRTGVELRQFDTPTPKQDRVTPIATAILNWSPNEDTQINAGFLVRNQPSVSLRGATFEEMRFGLDGRHRIAEKIYIRGEATIIRRAYDTGTREMETVLRPAVGFHTHTSRLFDSLNIELYYQFKRVDSNRTGFDRDRNIFGIETTLFF